MKAKVILMEIDLSSDITRYVLRKRRVNELGKKMSELENYEISKGSISNIENFKNNPHPKTLKIYLDKLGLKIKQVYEMADSVEQEIEEILFHLETIETIIEKQDLKSANHRLKKISLDDFHPLAPFVAYLQGKILYEEKQWNKAEKKFLVAIKLHHTYGITHNKNLISASYKSLASCSYFNNDLSQALKLVDLGLESYDDTQERKGVKYQLLGNKVLYLLKSSEKIKASRLLDKVWDDVKLLDDSYDDYSVLNLYKFRSTILRDEEHYDDALECCKNGTMISRKHWSINISHYLDFLIIAGSVFLKQHDYQKAWDRFELAIDSDQDLRAPRRHVDSYTYLGIMYNAQKKWQEASVHLDKALKIGRQIPDPFRLTKALIVKGNLYFQQKKWDQAILLYQECYSISKSNNFRQRQYSSLLKLADCFANIGDEKQLNFYTTKLYYLQKDLKITWEEDFYEI